MPQMAPINWLILLIFILSMMLILSSINYFINKIKPISTSMNKNIKIIWKW